METNKATDPGYELDWDSPIEKDMPDFLVLPEGEYGFTVASFERGRYSPKEGAKLPPCNMAVLQIRLDAPEGVSPDSIPQIKHTLFLHSRTEGLLCAFFTAIGQRQHGERLNMNWNTVTGARGRCKVGIRKWKSDKTGEDVQANEIKQFLEPPEGAAPKPGAQSRRF